MKDKIAVMIVHNDDRFHYSHYANGKPLSLKKLQPVAMIHSDSIYQATAIACRSNDWQQDDAVLVQLGQCERVSGLGDLLFDAADSTYYLITDHRLMPMVIESPSLRVKS